MAYEYGVVKIQLRRDTAANLSTVVLANGEPAYATDTQTLKIGNGSDTFSALGGIAGGGGGITDLTGDSVNQRLEYTNESGVTTYVDLAWTIDDTNLARLVSGTLDSSGIATFERDDATTFTVDFSPLFDGDITSITAGPGISGGGTTGDVTIAIDNTVIQSGDDVSLLNNDANYVASGDNVSLLVNDSNYVASGDNVSLLVNDTGFLTDIINDTSPQLGGSITTTGNRAIIIDASSHDESASILIRGTGDGSATDSGLLIMKNFGVASDDAYIWNYSNSKIIFATNGIGNVKIDENGQLGVNVVGYDPEYTLDVRGSGRIRSNLIAESLTIYNSFTLPTGDGTDGQVLTTDGSGNVNWESVGGNPLAVVSDTGVAGGGTSIANIVIIGSGEYAGITPHSGTLYYVTG